MKTLIRAIHFAGKSAALSLILAACLVGFSCFRHGDVGPYPETDYAWWSLPLSMLIVFVLGEDEP